MAPKCPSRVLIVFYKGNNVTYLGGFAQALMPEFVNYMSDLFRRATEVAGLVSSEKLRVYWFGIKQRSDMLMTVLCLLLCCLAG